MKPAHRRSLGMALTVVGWILSVGGVALGTIVTLPLFISDGGTLRFVVAALIVVGFVVMGPVFVNWGDQLRFPLGDLLSCPKCDYDLRGRPDSGCPECGWRHTLAGR